MKQGNLSNSKYVILNMQCFNLTYKEMFKKPFWITQRAIGLYHNKTLSHIHLKTTPRLKRDYIKTTLNKKRVYLESIQHWLKSGYCTCGEKTSQFTQKSLEIEETRLIFCPACVKYLIVCDVACYQLHFFHSMFKYFSLSQAMTQYNTTYN